MIDPRLQPLYYLHNFAAAMRWLKGMYSDVLSEEERVFIETFESLPVNAKALLVRLIMRKHDCFRGAKVCYPRNRRHRDGCSTPCCRWVARRRTAVDAGRTVRAVASG